MSHQITDLERLTAFSQVQALGQGEAKPGAQIRKEVSL